MSRDKSAELLADLTNALEYMAIDIAESEIAKDSRLLDVFREGGHQEMDDTFGYVVDEMVNLSREAALKTMGEVFSQHVKDLIHAVTVAYLDD